MMHGHSFADVAARTMSAQSSGYITSFLHTMLQTGLAMFLFVYAVVYLVVGGCIVFFMEHFVPHLAEDPSFPNSLADLSILVGFVYFIWINNNMQGYEQPVQNYFLFLQNIRGAAINLASTGNEEVRELLKYLVVLGDNVFRPGEPQITETSADLVLPEHCTARVDTMGPDGIKRYLMAHQCVIEALVSQKKTLMVSLAQNRLEAAGNAIEGREIGMQIAPPLVMNTHVIVFVLVWFGAWLPATMWARFGPWHSLWFYPLAMVVLTAPAIYRSWLGSPWSRERPWRESEHMRWPEQFIGDVQALFDDPKSASAERRRLQTNFKPLSELT